MEPERLSRLVADSLDGETRRTFEQRVREQAAGLREEVESGAFDSPGFAVGLELEVYAAEAGRPVTPPDAVFGVASKELGVHNAELNTDPDPLDADGLAAQAEEIARDLAAVRERAGDSEVALDAMWAVPPTEGTRTYLGAERTVGEVSAPERMRPDPRYLAIDAHIREAVGGTLPLSVPGVETTFPSILYESLTTSIQPHLQIPDAQRFPAYYNAAVRTLGPVLALSTNSPFLPPDLYDEGVDPQKLVDRTPHELRIEVFEQSVNHTETPKVRVPRDLESATDVADRVVADDLIAPFLREWLADGERSGLADRLWEFDHKRSTYWRWLRCVAGGQPVGGGDERSLRIEYRPIPTQPTVTDVVGMQALVAGLVRGLVAAGHPVTELPWAAARESFYNAVADGVFADLHWVSVTGERTTDPDLIFDEVFAHARRGLREAGLSEADIESYVGPIEARRNTATTPSVWKKRAVRERLSDGADLREAVVGAQREYLRLSRETDSFAEWL